MIAIKARINECRKPKTEKRGSSSEGIDYRKKYFNILRSKEKAFLLEEKGRAAAGEDSDEEEFINLALMAKLEEHEAISASSQVLTTDILDLFKEECKLSIDDMFNELYNLHISIKSLIKENARIKGTNDLLWKEMRCLKMNCFH